MTREDLHIGDYVRVIGDYLTKGHTILVTEIYTVGFRGKDLTGNWGFVTYPFCDVEPTNAPIWHRTRDELPKETCEVLVCWKTMKGERKYTQVAMYYEGVGFEDSDCYQIEPEYWMYIPELPKEN